MEEHGSGTMGDTSKRKREGPRKWILNLKVKQKNVTFKNNDTQTIGELLDSDDEIKDKREGKCTTANILVSMT